MSPRKKEPGTPPGPKPGGKCGLCGGQKFMFTRGKKHTCTRCNGTGKEPAR